MVRVEELLAVHTRLKQAGLSDLDVALGIIAAHEYGKHLHTTAEIARGLQTSEEHLQRLLKAGRA